MYEGQERSTTEISLSQLKSDVSVIASRMDIHEEHSQEFRKKLDINIEKILDSIFGNGRPGINRRLDKIEGSVRRGQALWSMLIAIGSAVTILWLKQKFNL